MAINNCLLPDEPEYGKCAKNDSTDCGGCSEAASLDEEPVDPPFVPKETIVIQRLTRSDF